MINFRYKQFETLSEADFKANLFYRQSEKPFFFKNGIVVYLQAGQKSVKQRGFCFSNPTSLTTSVKFRLFGNKVIF